MASVVEICNRALDKLGEAPIVSLGDEVKASRACARAFPAVRDAVLRDHPWNCAIHRTALAAEAEAPAWGYARRFPLPVDCLRVLAVEPEGAGWTVEGRAVLTDAAGPLRLRYVRRLADAGLIDPLLAEAIAARLAAELCETLTQSTSKRQALLEDYAEIVTRARAADGQEGSPPPVAESPWVLARR